MICPVIPILYTSFKFLCCFLGIGVNLNTLIPTIITFGIRMHRQNYYTSQKQNRKLIVPLMYRLSAKYGCRLSEDFVSQTVDPCYSQLSPDCAHKEHIDSHQLPKPQTLTEARIMEGTRTLTCVTSGTVFL